MWLDAQRDYMTTNGLIGCELIYHYLGECEQGLKANPMTEEDNSIRKPFYILIIFNNKKFSISLFQCYFAPPTW